MKDRIVQIMEVERLTPSSFADKLHVGRAVVSHILNGRNNPSLDVVMRILDAMPYIDSDWLLMGKGSMRKEDNMPDSVPQSSPNVTKGLDLFDSNVIEKETNVTNVLQEADMPIQAANPPVTPQTEPTKTTNESRLPIAIPVSDKKISKIIIYYSDKTFQAFNPDNEGL